MVTFSCDTPECEKQSLSQREVVNVVVQVVDPEAGTAQIQQQFCIDHGDEVMAQLQKLGFDFES